MSPPGRVRMVRSEPGLPYEGRLVDVSARGLRFECGERRPGPGSPVTLEVILDDPTRPAGPPRLVLDGVGRIVWVEAVDGAGAQAGVCFDAPMDVRRSFPQVRIY